MGEGWGEEDVNRRGKGDSTLSMRLEETVGCIGTKGAYHVVYTKYTVQTDLGLATWSYLEVLSMTFRTKLHVDVEASR